MSNTIKVTCIDCGREIDYDGRIIACPHCYMEFESDEISEWKKQLAEKTRAAEGEKTPPAKDKSAEESKKVTADTPPVESSSGGTDGKRIDTSRTESKTPDAFGIDRTEGAATKKQESPTVVYEWRGNIFYAGQEKNAFLFILRNGYIDEVLESGGAVTSKAKQLLSAMGKREPNLSLFEREHKFFEIMYGTVFDGEDLPLFVKNRIGLPMANSRAELMKKIENNQYQDIQFELFGKWVSFAELARRGVICAYLRLADESPLVLREYFEQSGKRLYIDEDYRCVDLGGDWDICRLDPLMFMRYDYYLDREDIYEPCIGYDESATFDAEFLSAYGGYVNADCTVKEFMKAYFYLLSVACNRVDECDVFGVTVRGADVTSMLLEAAEDAAERGMRNKFLLMRQLLINKVFGEYNSPGEKAVAAAENAETALFVAYYKYVGKPKKLLYYNGKYQSASDIARTVRKRGAIGNILEDNSATGFLAAVENCVKVDITGIKTEIQNGIKIILEGLK